MEEKAVNAIERHILFTKEYQDLGAEESVWQNMEECITKAKKNLLPESVTCTVNLNGISVYADPMLEKVLYTLIDNTLRYGEKASDIRFSYQITDQQELIVLYEDNGVGVRVPEKERIFERGFGKNTGFGLFLAREILSITGLSIRECGKPGAGVLFEILIPSGKLLI